MSNIYSAGADLSLLKKSLEEVDFTGLFHDRTIDRLLIELVDFQNPLRMIMRRMPGSGEGYMVRKRTPGTTTGTDVDDTDSFVEETGSYTEEFFAYKTLGTQGKVTRRVQKTGRLVTDLLAEEMEAKSREIRDLEEFRMFWGQAPTVNTKQIKGLNAHMNDLTTQIVALTLNSVGAPLTLAKFDEVMDKVITGPPGVIVTSRVGRRKINALLQSTQRFNDRIEVPGGFRVLSYNDTPILISTNIPDTLQVSSGGTITSLTGGSTTAMFVIDLNHVFMSILTELTMMPLARRSSQFEEFDIFEDMSQVVRDKRAVAMVTGWGAQS
jgi:hypothetical protein